MWRLFVAQIFEVDNRIVEIAVGKEEINPIFLELLLEESETKDIDEKKYFAEEE